MMYEIFTCIYNLPGEWKSIDCSTVDDPDNVTLLFKRKGSNKISFPSVDNKKIKLVSKHVFNITNLQYNDTGMYMCGKQVLWNDTHYLVIFFEERIVVRKGKFCINRQLHFFVAKNSTRSHKHYKLLLSGKIKLTMFVSAL